VKNKLLVIGAGAMGGGIARQLVSMHAFAADEIAVVERDVQKHTELKQMGVRVFNDFAQCDVSEYQIILIAVKPQDAEVVLQQLRVLVTQQHLIISIMAGVTLDALERALKQKRIVRVMPNLAATVGKGVSAWFTTAGEQDQALVKKMLGALGTELQVEDDAAIDRITAIVGCGPGYLYRFADDLVTAAVKLGLSEKTALELVKATILGASALWEKSNDLPRELVQKVASKGGATEAALAVLDENKTAEIWQQAVAAAYARVRALGQKRP
jgi:pyrroline-5-carboxylate reductase